MKSKTQVASLLLLAVFSMGTGFGLGAKPVSESPKKPFADPDRNPAKDSILVFQRKTMVAQKSQRPSSLKPVVIAVIDTGFDSSHRDLRGHTWKNLREVENGIDDDGNGFTDDTQGFDFVDGTSKVKDTHGHGTHIAGIIARNSPKAQLMNLKYFDRRVDGLVALRNSVAAMEYAIKMNVDIINYSGGGMAPSPDELRVLKLASQKGILVVAAAGNESANSEMQPFYPANYSLSNILSVTAIQEKGDASEILPSSNFGKRSVAVAAEGKDVISTMPGDRHGAMTGTSQATAFVAATAAEIIEESRGRGERLSPEEVIDRIIVSSKISPKLKDRTRYGSRLESRRALAFRGQGETKRTLREREKFIEAFASELSKLESQAQVNPLKP